MIKPIMKSPLAKKAILGTMMIGATIGGASATKNNNSTSQLPQYTEISREASLGAKTMAAPVDTTKNKKSNNGFDELEWLLWLFDIPIDHSDKKTQTVSKQEPTTIYSGDRYEDLDNYVKRFETPPLNEFGFLESVDDYIDNVYNIIGLNGAAIELRAHCSSKLFAKAMSSFKENFSNQLTKEEKEKLDDLMLIGSKDNLYNTKRNQRYGINSKVGNIKAEDAIKLLDEYAEKNLKNTNLNAYKEYIDRSQTFNSLQGNSKNDMLKAKLIAYKTYLLDLLIAQECCKSLPNWQNELEKYVIREITKSAPSPECIPESSKITLSKNDLVPNFKIDRNDALDDLLVKSFNNTSLGVLKNRLKSEYNNKFYLKHLLNSGYETLGLYGMSIIQARIIAKMTMLQATVDFGLKDTSPFLGSMGSATYRDIASVIGPHEFECDYYSVAHSVLPYDDITYILSEKGKVSAKEAIRKLDNLANSALKKQEDIDEYKNKVNSFNIAQNGSKTPEQKANLIAYKVLLLEKLRGCEIAESNDYYYLESKIYNDKKRKKAWIENWNNHFANIELKPIP